MGIICWGGEGGLRFKGGRKEIFPRDQPFRGRRYHKGPFEGAGGRGRKGSVVVRGGGPGVVGRE